MLGHRNRLSQGGNTQLVRNWYLKCQKEAVSVSAACVCFALNSPIITTLRMGLNLLIHIHMKGQSQMGKTLAKYGFQLLAVLQQHTANSVQSSSVLGQTQVSSSEGSRARLLLSRALVFPPPPPTMLSSQRVFCFNARFDTG